ncbi:MAG: hypothetical protein H6575_05330 [Lewinellaceae bacterium]|nr:hypothetical protein [Saprospiraceae bacterium]MCB9353965.1 hypothetical protein [Lewinellaceae bacterium]
MNNLKRIALLIAFCSFLIACADSGADKQKPVQPAPATTAAAKACMDSIIAFDSRVGTIRNHACEKQSLSKTITEYTEALENADFAACPVAFKNAFLKHIQAWRNALAVTDKYPELRGEMHDLFNKIESGDDGPVFKTLVADIWATWADIEKVMKS